MIEKLKNAPYRTKNLLLLGAVLIVGYLSWTSAISRTLALYGELERTQGRIERAEGAEERIAELRGKLARMERAEGEEEDMEPQQRLLERVGALCEKHELRVHSVPAPHRLEEGGSRVSSFFIEVEGDFKGLLKLLHVLEREGGGAHVSNVTFYSERKLSTRSTRLYGRILVQHVEHT